MKKYFPILFLFIASGVFAQEKLLKDLDGDGIEDRVYMKNSRIVCRLSSEQFRKIQSQEIEVLNTMSGIRETNNGFEFFNDWMRAGYANQFHYDKQVKRMRLIGMS